MKPLSLAVALAATFCCALLASVPALAAPEDLEQKSSAAADRVERLSGRLNEDRAAYDQASQKAEAAATREAEISSEIETGAARSAALRQELDTETSRLGATRKRLRRAERVCLPKDSLRSTWADRGRPLTSFLARPTSAS